MNKFHFLWREETSFFLNYSTLVHSGIFLQISPSSLSNRFFLTLDMKLKNEFKRRLSSSLWHYRLWSFKSRNTKLERVLHKINIPKGNYWIFRIGLMGSLSSLQKSELLKLIISFFHYFGCQNWDQWHKMSGKNSHIYFFYFRFKNKRVWAEKIGKKRKNSKNLKVAGNYPNI